MKTTLLSVAAFFVVVTAKAQTFSENFNSATIASLTNNCWIVSGATTTTLSGEAINGTSIYSAPATNGNAKTDLYTPVLTATSSSLTVNFDYRITQTLTANAVRLIEVGLVSSSGILVKQNTITMIAGTNTDVKNFSHTFTGVVPNNYRVVFRLSGSNGNGNVRIVLDNISISTVNLYSTPGNCEFVAISASVLPVVLKEFSAQLNNNKVDLNWVTATEVNASHFVIERSYTGNEYSEIATVMAYGNTTEEKTYKFTDQSFASDKVVAYYRLRQVDLDGKQEYSSTRIIRISKQNQNTVTILTFPNPVSSEVRITIPNNWQGKKVTYELMNANGQTVRKIETASSSQTETMNVSNLSRGFYVVKVSHNGETAQQKIVKQ